MKAGPGRENQDALHCSPPSAAFVFLWALNLVAAVLESSSMGLAWQQASKASQDPEGSELLDPMTASCWISATRLSGNYDIPIDVRIWSGRRTGSIAVVPKVSRSFSETSFQDGFDRAAGVEDHCYPKGRARKTCPASEGKMHCTACPPLALSLRGRFVRFCNPFASHALRSEAG